jgi:hypothetical protein
MSNVLTPGPLLNDLFRVQRLNERAISFPQLAAYCDAVEASCEALGDPIVWPVGAAAERISGAVVLSSCGRVRVRDWNSRVDGEHVLLLTVAAVTPLGLVAAAKQAKALGARKVSACGVDVKGSEAAELREWIDGYLALSVASERKPLAVA